jgi:hypothetical protein
MTTRIDKRFAELRIEGRTALVTFLMCGDPDLDTSLQLIEALPGAGADVIEIGMPFTDPMADGPSIQAAGLRALKAGGSMLKTLGLVKAFRANNDHTPIVLMGYVNPILSYGEARLAADAGQVPVLVVDPHVGRPLDDLLMELNALGPSLPGAVLMLAPIDPASGVRDRPPTLPGLGFGCGWVFTSHRARGQKQRSYDLFTIRRDGAKGQPVARGSDLVEADTARA